MDFKSMLTQLSQLSEATKETKTGRIHKAGPGGYGRKFDTDEEGDEKEEKKAEAPKKRGRPPKTGEHSPEEKAKAEKREKAGKELQSFIVGNIPKNSKELDKLPKRKHSLKEWVQEVEQKYVAEAVPPGMKPLAILDPKNQNAGAGVVTSKNPAIQKMLGGLDPKDVQIVMTTPQQQQQQPTATTGGATTQPAMSEEGDKWIQKAIKHPGALRKKLHAKEGEPIPAGKLEKATHSKNPTTAKQARLAQTLRGLKKEDVAEGDIPSVSGVDTRGAGLGVGRNKDVLEVSQKLATKAFAKRTADAFEKGDYSTSREEDDEAIKASEKADKTYARIGKRWGTDAQKKADKAASKEIYGVHEGAKPDFLDLDKDGNKKESMKKAAADKKKKKVNESMHKHTAARLLGKSHALAKEGYNCKYDDMDEAYEYHEGYKEGLDECYGQMPIVGLVKENPAATVSGMASQAMPTMEDDMDEGIVGGALGGLAGGAVGGLPGAAAGYALGSKFSDDLSEDDMEEGNAFTAALARTPKGGKFNVGGKSFTDRSNYDSKLDEFAFEAWDRELNSLLTESEEVSEGMTVSISKGQQGSPDSVSVSAQDGEAEQLLNLIKHSGFGLFSDQSNGISGDQEVTSKPGGIDVVGDHDGMMALIKKVSGGSEPAGSHDYADEEGHEEGHEHTDEETCNECGYMETDCQCDKEPIDEVESEDQMLYQVAEDNPPDSGAAEEEEEIQDTAQANQSAAEEDEADAENDEEDDEEVSESIHLDEWANQAGKGPGKGTDAQFEQDIEFMTKVISGGLNKPKSTGQTTIPVIAGQNERMEDPAAWAKLAGIKK